MPRLIYNRGAIGLVDMWVIAIELFVIVDGGSYLPHRQKQI